MRIERMAMLIGLFVGMAALVTGGAVDLNQYLWKNRVLILSAPSKDDEQLKQQQTIFEQHRHDLEERQLVVLAVTNDDPSSLRTKFHLDPGEFTLVLVGKDGGEKHRWRHSVGMESINGVIDRMPMRQEEMRGK